MVYYTYSIANDLNGQTVDVTLYDTINADSQIRSTSICVGTDVSGDNLNIHFTASLSPAGENALNNIISNFVSYSPPLVKNNAKYLYPTTPKVSSTSYTVIGFTIYPASTAGIITGIDFLGYMDPGTTSYQVQIINKTDNTIVAQQTFTNTSISQQQSFTTIQNQPSGLCTLEASIKVTKNGTATKNAYVHHISFWTN